MVNLPNKSEILDQTIPTGDWKLYYGAIRDFIAQGFMGSDVEKIEIVSGKITPSKAFIELDCENQTSNDELENIDFSLLPTSQWLFIMSNPLRSIKVKNTFGGDGEIVTFNNADVVLKPSDVIILRRSSNSWVQVDICSYSRATDEQYALGNDKFLFPTLSQMKTLAVAQLGVVFFTSTFDSPAGALPCDDTLRHGDTFPYFWENMLVPGKVPTVEMSVYDANKAGGKYRFFGVDLANKTFKCPNLAAVTMDGVPYKPYVQVVNSKSDKSFAEEQAILDQCLTVQVSVNAKGEEIVSYVNTSKQEIGALKVSALEEIDSSRVSAVGAVNTAQSSAVAAVNSAKDSAIGSIQTAAQSQLSSFNANATAKTDAFNSNATTKTSDFDANATTKTDAFNATATQATNLVVDKVYEAETFAEQAKAAADSVAYIINEIVESGGTVFPLENKIYKMTISSSTSFILPVPADKTKFNQIKIMAEIVGAPTIDLGTSYFFNKTAPTLSAGNFDILYDYDNKMASWVVGALSKGTV